MVNQAFLETLNDSFDEEKVKAKYADKNALKTLYLRSGKNKKTGEPEGQPLAITPLQPFEEVIHGVFHNTKEEGKKFNTYPTYICDRTYAKFDPIFRNSCQVCKDDPSKPPYTASLFGSWVHDYEGKKYAPEGSDQEYDIDPERIAVVRHGQDWENLKALKTLNDEGKFNSNDYTIQLKCIGEGKDRRYLPPIELLKSEMGPDRKKEVPKAILLKWQSLTKEERIRKVLAGLRNVRWDIWGIEPPEEPENKEEVEEPILTEAAELPKGTSKKLLAK